MNINEQIVAVSLKVVHVWILWHVEVILRAPSLLLKGVWTYGRLSRTCSALVVRFCNFPTVPATSVRSTLFSCYHDIRVVQ